MKKKIKLVLELLNNSDAPSYEEVKNAIREKWGEDFSNITPSHVIQKGEKLQIFKHIKNEFVDAEDFIKHNYESGRHLNGAYGLVVIEYLDNIDDVIKPGSFIVGIDSEEFLPERKNAGRVTAVLRKLGSGKYQYFVFPYGMHLENNEYFLTSQE